MTRNNADFRGDPTHLTARHIVENYEPGDVGFADALPWENDTWSNSFEEEPHEMWDRKYHESTEPGFWEGKRQPPLKNIILKKGYDESHPVELEHSHTPGNEYKAINHGHHRIAVMYNHFPDTPIPVVIKHVGG